MNTARYISWFSCGAASAVATKLAIDRFDDVRVIYFDTGSEHEDNKRFLKDCEEWFDQEIEVAKSETYHDIWDVFEKTRYLVGVGGARCTSELKRKVAESFIDWGKNQQFEIFGYTADEKNRVDRFITHNLERKIVPILVDEGINKEACYSILVKAGIDLPAMYKLGYNNNNCIGCVKGQGGYWNKIRRDFPEVFERMSAIERELNIAINKSYAGDGKRKRLFLDELPEDFGRDVKPPPIDCGLICEVD